MEQTAENQETALSCPGQSYEVAFQTSPRRLTPRVLLDLSDAPASLPARWRAYILRVTDEDNPLDDKARRALGQEYLWPLLDAIVVSWNSPRPFTPEAVRRYLYPCYGAYLVGLAAKLMEGNPPDRYLKGAGIQSVTPVPRTGPVSASKETASEKTASESGMASEPAAAALP